MSQMRVALAGTTAQSTLQAVLVDAWLPRAAAARPDVPAVNALRYADLLVAADAGARRLAARGARAGTASAWRCRRARPSPWRCTHACCSAPWRSRSTRGCRRGASASPRARLRVVVEAPLPSGEGDERAPRRAARPRRGRGRRPHLGTSGAPKPVELTYGNWLWSALGLGVALGCDPDERWLCALPLSHVGGLSILLRSAIYATTAVVHERFDTDRAAARRCAARTGRRSSRSCRRRSRGCSTPGLRAAAGAALGADRRRPVPAALLDRAARRGVPVAPTYGLTEACSQVGDDTGAPLFCTRVRARAPTARSSSPARPSPRGRRPVLRDRRPRRARRATAACESSGARPTRSSAAARTSRRPRSRPCSEPPGGRRGRGARPARRGVGRGGRGHRRAARRARTSPRPSCARTAPRGWPRYKVPKDFGFADRAAAHALGQAPAPGAG